MSITPKRKGYRKQTSVKYAHLKGSELIDGVSRITVESKRTITEEGIQIGRKLKYFRLKRGEKMVKGLSVARLAKMTGISPASLWRYEAGHEIPPDCITRLCEALKIKPSSLERRKELTAFKSLDMLVLDVNGLRNFLGGCDDATLKWAHDNLLKMKSYIKTKRKEAWERGEKFDL